MADITIAVFESRTQNKKMFIYTHMHQKTIQEKCSNLNIKDTKNSKKKKVLNLLNISLLSLKYLIYMK